MVRIEVNCWERIRKVWVRVSKQFGFRKSAGLIKLHNDVRRCEYEDVHILWEMLHRNEADVARSRKGQFWTQCSPLLCR